MTTASYTGTLAEVLAGHEVLMAHEGQLEHRDASGGLATGTTIVPSMVSGPAA